MSKPRSHVDDLRGAGKLAVAATRGVTSLVEAMHATIASGPAVLGRPLALPARLATGLVYGSIRGVTAVVGAGIDRALAQLAPLLGESVPGPERDAVLAALNGVLGDYLHETANPLAIDMQLHVRGEPGAKLLVLVHGSSMNDRQWLQGGHDHGAALATLGYTPIYLHYNTGLHISTNGRALANQLSALIASWPVPVEELVLLGHSMGGLVARSACHIGGAWLPHVRALITLGSPHHGAPLERIGNWLGVALGISRYSAPLAALARIRSAGVTDLRYGNIVDEDWQDHDRFAPGFDRRSPVALPVPCFALAGTLSTEPGERLRGDGLVPVDSALGQHATPALTLDAQRSIVYATGHVQLLRSPEVHATIRGWLALEPARHT